jgi:hypothetical protein
MAQAGDVLVAAPRGMEETRMSIKVQFNQIDEFLEELTQEREAVTDRILRVTYVHAQQSGMPIVQLSVVAGVLVRGVLIEFVQRCGDLWMRRSDSDAQTTQRAQDLLLRLEEAAHRLDLQIRRGRFLTTPDKA